MKYTWELHDITVGRRVQSAHRPSEVFMIGYDPALSEEVNHTLVSLSDGMLAMRHQTRGDLMRSFNAGGMRPMDIDTKSDVGTKS